MRSEITVNQTKSFPKLMVPKESFIDQNYIVLFTHRNEGTVLWCEIDCVHRVGYHSYSWSSDCFNDFKGTLVLTEGE